MAPPILAVVSTDRQHTISTATLMSYSCGRTRPLPFQESPASVGLAEISLNCRNKFPTHRFFLRAIPLLSSAGALFPRKTWHCTLFVLDCVPHNRNRFALYHLPVKKHPLDKGLPIMVPPSVARQQQRYAKPRMIHNNNMPTTTSSSLESAATTSSDDGTRHSQQPPMISLPMTEQGMRKLESALQLYLKGGGGGSSSGKRRLSYHEFCRCVSKMAGSSALAVGLGSGSSGRRRWSSSSSSLPDDSAILRLSREERFWHDLYCVAVPVLYDVNGMGDLVTVELPPGQNRFQEMCRLTTMATEQGVPETKSKFAVDLLMSLRKPATKPNKTVAMDAKPKPTNHDVAESLLVASEPVSVSTTTASSSTAATKPLTIEERIRARAMERERDMQQADAARKDPREDWVAVADLLYTHANQVLRRFHKGSRFQTKQAAGSGPISTKCATTFADIVKNVIPDRPRKEIASLFEGIIFSCPGSTFLKWQDPKSGRNGNPISKEATVWIDIADYKRVRAVLNGEEPPAPASLKQAPSTSEITPVSSPAMTKGGKPSVVTISSKKYAAIPSVENDTLSKKRPLPLQDSPRASKTLKSLTAAAVRTSNIASESNISAGRQVVGLKRTGEDLEPEQSHRKRSHMPSCMEESDSDGSSLPKMSGIHNRRRLGDDSDSDNDKDRMHREARKSCQNNGLRINPGHILWDADHNGGIVIQPSLELPRGLRRLFLALNNDERI
jgi:hypothetical protein